MPRIPAAPTAMLPPSVQPSISTAHSLLLLQEYTHTLDSLPLDLSRQFADLRELDAVLSASTASVTHKIYELIDLIESPAASRDERLAKLGEVAEEAQRLKLGGEDKIRVASQAADTLASHQAHLNALLTAVVPYDTSFTPSHLYLRTLYPHIPPRPVQDATPLEGSRRRRGVGGGGGGGRGQLGGMLAVDSLSPVKSRKRVRDEDEPQPTPKRDRETVSLSANKRSGASVSKAKRVENHNHAHAHAHTHRAGSPSAESVVSITSHTVSQSVASHSHSRLAAPPTQSAPQAAPRVTQHHAVAPAPPADDGDGGDEVDHDGGRYCYCQGPSYGEMVGCDDEHCAFEWFHLTCIGLTSAPKGGTWYCDDCKAKRTGSKKRSSNKRRAGGTKNGGSGNGGGTSSLGGGGASGMGGGGGGNGGTRAGRGRT